MRRRDFLSLIPAAALAQSAPKPPQRHPQVFSVAWLPDGRFATGMFREARIINMTTGRVVSYEGHADAVRALAFSADGKYLAAAGGRPGVKGELKIWEVDSATAIATAQGHSDCIYGAAFAPNGRYIATASYDKLIKLWDAKSAKEIRTLKDHIDAVYAVAFTPDGSRLLSASADRSVKVWNPETGERLYTMSEPLDGLNTLALDPTGKLVAAGGNDKTIRIWKLGERSGELVNTLIAHEDAILQLSWSPDGKTIISSSADRTVKVFDAATLAEQKSIRQPDWVLGLKFSLDGTHFVAGRYDGSFTNYDMAYLGTL